MKVALPSLDQLVELSTELDSQLAFEIPQKSSFDFYISQHYSRFLAGAGSITTLRSVSRKQLFLFEEKIASTDSHSAKLSSNIRKYNQAKSQLDKNGFSIRSMIHAHQRAFKGTAAGKIRTKPCYIQKRRIEFVSHKNILYLMGQWEKFLNNPNISDLAKTILGHGYFIGIHPFVDGNGRLSRLLVKTSARKNLHLAVNPLLFNLFNQMNFRHAMEEFFQANPNQIFFSFWKKALQQSLKTQKIFRNELNQAFLALEEIGLTQKEIFWMFNHPLTSKKEIQNYLGEKHYQLFNKHYLLTNIDDSLEIFQINPPAIVISKMDSLLFS